MKITITAPDTMKTSIECDSFEFDSGFLKIIKPKDTEVLEMYLPLARILIIENYGPLKPKTKKTTKK